MKRSWWLKFTGFLFLLGISIFVLIPTFLNYSQDSHYPVKSRINLGLDLQGGLYMVLGIDFKKVYHDEVIGYARKIEYLLGDEGVKVKLGELDETDPLDPKHSIFLSDLSQKEKAIALVKKFFPSIIRLTKDDENQLGYGLTKIEKTKIEEQSVTKSIEVIRNRIDEFGVTEPEIVSQGNDRIIVALPGVKDIDRAKNLIGKTAKLSFKMVNDEVPYTTINSWLEKASNAGISYKEGNRFSDYLKTLNDYLKEDIPEGYELAFEKKVSKLTNEIESQIPYLVEKASKLGGDALQDARVQIDQQKNEPYVSLEFKAQGAKIFEQLTGENIGKRLAIILDGNVYSAPNIQTKIGGGRAQITLGSGGYNRLLKEAKDLALVLRAGALPVQLDFLEQRTVGQVLDRIQLQRQELRRQ